MNEVEPKAVRRDQRAGLLHVRAQCVSQGCMKQVSRRVITPRRVACGRIDFGGDQIALVQAAVRQMHTMQPRSAGRDLVTPSTAAEAPEASDRSSPTSDTWPPDST